MARRYWVMIDGKRLYAATLGAAKRIAERAANQVGRAVQVGYDELQPRKRRTSYRRNPMMGGVNFTGEEWLILVEGPNGRRGKAYAGSEAEAKRDVRVLKKQGYRVLECIQIKDAYGS